MKKLSLKQHCLIGNAIMLLGAILAIAGIVMRDGDRIHYLVWIALGVIIASVVYKVSTLKCPHCGGGLSVRYKLPETCPNCNKSIHPEASEHEEADR